MKVEDQIEIDRPLLIGEPFIRSIFDAFEEATQIVLERMSNQHGISKLDLSRISKGEIPKDINEYLISVIASRIEERLDTEYKVSFENGTTVRTSDYEEFLRTLQSEPSYPKAIDTTFGRYHDLHIKISIGGYRKNLSFAIHGSRRDVTHIRTIIEKSAKLAIAPYTFLRSPWLWNVTGAALWLIIGLLLIVIFRSYLPKDGFTVFSGPWVFTNILSAIIAFICFELAEKAKELFPRLEFNFGIRYRRLKERRFIMLWIIGTVAIPIILSAIFGS